VPEVTSLIISSTKKARVKFTLNKRTVQAANRMGSSQCFGFGQFAVVKSMCRWLHNIFFPWNNRIDEVTWAY
jgi:hypothetical protein